MTIDPSTSPPVWKAGSIWLDSAPIAGGQGQPGAPGPAGPPAESTGEHCSLAWVYEADVLLSSDWIDPSRRYTAAFCLATMGTSRHMLRTALHVLANLMLLESALHEAPLSGRLHSDIFDGHGQDQNQLQPRAGPVIRVGRECCHDLLLQTMHHHWALRAHATACTHSSLPQASAKPESMRQSITSTEAITHGQHN